jgi:formylglycine-generating enzyme required for sulfatase activity
MLSKRLLLVVMLLSLLAFVSPSQSRDNRGLTVTQGKGSIASLGNYYALIVGINQYKEWNALRTAVKDAVGLNDILVKRYGFKSDHIRLMTDQAATRRRIVQALRNLAANLKDQDNLLVYFAGHGQLDDLTGDGYWIPAEGRLKDPTTWISHATVKSILSSEKVKGKNIVVVADSCYSGTLLRGGPSLLSMSEQTYRGKVLTLASRRSRQVITSGGLEPVADGGRDGHSLFAYYFLKALKENDRDVIDLENLFHSRVWRYVTEIGGQRPNVGRLKTPMDEDGQFVLAAADISGVKRTPGIPPKRPSDHVPSVPVAEPGPAPTDPLEAALLKVQQLEHEKNRARELKTEKFRNLLDDLKKYQIVESSELSDETKQSVWEGLKRKYPRWGYGAEYGDSEALLERALAEDQDGDMAEIAKASGMKLTKTNSSGMKFVYISPGTFMMGSPANEKDRDNDEKQHQVTLSQGYYLQSTEVTQGQWKAVMGNNPSYFKDCGGDCPVEQVSWEDVQEFIRRLNQREGDDIYRLPTEAEWEYACRAGSNDRFCFGDDEGRLSEYAWYDSNSGKKTHGVAQKKPNPWGLYDMHGNVWEWCHDWFGDYPSGSVTDPSGPSGGSVRVLRGGSWIYGPGYVRCADRFRGDPGVRCDDLGFRLLRTP